MMELLKELFLAATSFPTIIFSIALGLVLLYWIVSAATGLGDSVDGALEGVAEGLVEGLVEGVGEGVIEGMADGVLDGTADGLLEGVGEGAAEGLGESGSSALGRALGCLGVTAVPVTLFLSILVLLSWLASLGLSRLLGRHVSLGLTGGVLSALIVSGALILGLVATSWVVRPLKPLFRSDHTIHRSDFVGQICTVTTLRVGTDFGMAEYDDGQAGLLLQVRCPFDNSLTRGDRARVVAYDPGADSLVLDPEAADAEDVRSDPAATAAPHEKPNTEES